MNFVICSLFCPTIIVQPSAISSHVSTRYIVPEHALIRQWQFATDGFYDRPENYVTPYINAVEFMIVTDNAYFMFKRIRISRVHLSVIIHNLI